MRIFAWLFPLVLAGQTSEWGCSLYYSSRWNDVFGYEQVKTELNLPGFSVRPYVSTRLVADTKPGDQYQALSERSFILAAGLSAVAEVYGVGGSQ